MITKTRLQYAAAAAAFLSIIGFELYLINTVSSRLDSLEEVISANGSASAQPLSLDSEAIGGDGYFSERDIECLATNAYFEARDEPVAGQIGVTQVVLNRVESDLFPDSVCDVVFQAVEGRDGQPIRNRCQFSWYCDGRSDIPRNWKAYTSIYRVVSDVARDRATGEGNDITKGSLFYHADYVNPRWNRRMDKEVQLGRHIFWSVRNDS
jgi:spore germination cell wall hydrolase CwlJ-like protein